MIATDRISALDVTLKNRIADKGAVLTQLSRFWFERTKDVMPNHMISMNTADMPEFFRTPESERRSMLCKKLTMLPIECIVRGCITGSGWESYKKSGTVCGIQFPVSLQESERLPEPIFTPSTKAKIGDHDGNINLACHVEVLGKAFPGKGREYARTIRDKTLVLYRFCADHTETRGIAIADVKFEFGLNEAGKAVLTDEMLIPGSSRFQPLGDHVSGRSQPSFDKRSVRDRLKVNPDSNYKLPQDVIDKTTAKHEEAYAMLTGKELD